jgi:hypothetical protein
VQTILDFRRESTIASFGDHGFTLTLPFGDHGLRQRVSKAEADSVTTTGICPMRQISALTDINMLSQ